MGGAEEQGNATLTAEYNFWWDPEAAHIVIHMVSFVWGGKGSLRPWIWQERCAPLLASLYARHSCLQLAVRR